jgi:hypothetical protein
MNEDELREFLNSFNARAGKLGIPHRQRPAAAFRALSESKGLIIHFPSPLTTFVTTWFEQNSPPGSHALGAIFTGAYFFDAACWKVEIPVGYGTFQLEIRDGIRSMPEPVYERLAADKRQLMDYALYWCDCCDYGYGFNSLYTTYQGPAKAMLFAADEQLRTIVSLLLEHRRPLSAASEASRMAFEMFLKCFLLHHVGLDLERVKGIGHNLSNLLKTIVENPAGSGLRPLTPHVAAFPRVGERYGGRQPMLDRVSFLHSIAQWTGTAFVRTLTDRNTRKRMNLPAT